MKILRWSAMALAAAAGYAGCGSSSSCGGTNVNANSNIPAISCNPNGVGGATTVNQNGVCVPVSQVNTQ